MFILATQHFSIFKALCKKVCCGHVAHGLNTNIFLKSFLNESHSLLVRFLVLVTTMVTKVDHGNHRSNHRSYYDGNTSFLQEYMFLSDFLWFPIIFDSFHTQ